MMTILSFLADRLGISKLLAGVGSFLIIILACAAAYFVIQHRADNRLKDARHQGAMDERGQQNGKVIEDVKKANDATHLRDPSRDERLCKQDSRTPENCQ